MPRPQRDEATRMRTRVAAKMSLLSWFSGTLIIIFNSDFLNIKNSFSFI